MVAVRLVAQHKRQAVRAVAVSVAQKTKPPAAVRHMEQVAAVLMKTAQAAMVTQAFALLLIKGGAAWIGRRFWRRLYLPWRR